MSKFISIHNDKKFIRIRNHNTNVVSYMNKSNLVVQQDNANSFFMKNDDYVKYFRFIDIKQPVTRTLGELIQAIVTMIQTEDISQLMIINEMKRSDVVLDLNFYSDKNNLLDEIIMSNDSVTNNPNIEFVSASNFVTMNMNNLDVNTSNIIIRQSKEYVNVPPGKINISLLSGVLYNNMLTSDITTTSNHALSKIGLFDDNTNFSSSLVPNYNSGNGIFFQYDSASNVNAYSNLSLVLRLKNNDIVVNQGNWNIDQANGLGPSGVTFDVTNLNTFVFRFGTLPKSTIEAGFMHNGYVILVHEFINQGGHNFFTKLPLRWELSQFADESITSGVQMIQTNTVVYSNEKHYIQPIQHSAICPNTNIPNAKEINSVARKDVVFHIRLNKNYIRSKIKLTKMTLLNKHTDATIIMWKLLKNATLTNLEYISSTTLNEDGSIDSQTTSSSTIDDTFEDLYDEDLYNNVSRADILSLNTTQEYNLDSDTNTINNYLDVEDNTGTLISSGFIKGMTYIDIDMKNDFNILLSDIQGVSDTYTLLVEYINSPADIQAVLSWDEYE